ncbi:methyltransferase [Nocardia jiangxiensis]|uniref:Methyltransferase n=1 Tax=Nocardia jiangxiensis TaxID=282685 RepID=A0ABW6RYV3_9NOCA
MRKLSKAAAAAHVEACRLTDLARELSEAEKQFVLDNFHESTVLGHATGGVFFTPSALARAMTIHVVGTRIIDLGAGIGHLAFACRNMLDHRHNGEPVREFVCVEKNPELVRVGMKVVPEALWVCQDMFALAPRRFRFDTAIANPPYGRAPRSDTRPGYSGGRFEYHAIALAAQFARHGVFLIPQTSTPFCRSGHDHFVANTEDAEYSRFVAGTGIALMPSCGIDTSQYDRSWHHRPVRTEVALADFTDPTVLRAHRRSSPVLSFPHRTALGRARPHWRTR